MSFVKVTFGGIGAVALTVGATLALSPMAVNAATIHATAAEIIKDGPRGSANGRNDITNALDEADGAFFELGYDAVVEFQFGAPTGQAFFASGALIEVTANNSLNWKEAVLIEVGRRGIADSLVAVEPNPFINTETFDNPVFTFDGGPFDTVRLTDLTRALFSGNAGGSGSSSIGAGAGLGNGTGGGQSASSPSTTGPTGGFDVDAITVTPVTAVPLPAAGLLLAGALGGLAALRRRRRNHPA